MSEQTLLKKMVLEEQMGFLCEELGDPKRYFPYLRSKGTLDNIDCQSIRAQITLKEQVEEMISLLKGRQSTKGEHAFDVLVEALKQQRVQAHIARSLQKALAKAKEEKVSSNGVLSRTSKQLPQEESQKSSPSAAAAAAAAVIKEPDESKPYEVHPLHEVHPRYGALPFHPVDQSVAASSPVTEGQMERTVDPKYGLLPPRCGQQEYTENLVSEQYFNGSDSEPGGQSQPNSMLTNSSYSDSATTSSHLVSHGSEASCLSDTSDSQKVGITDLKAKVEDLTLKLKEAEAENRRKDDIIRSMQQQLEKVLKPVSGYGIQPGHPFKLKMNGSDTQVHTMVTPSGTYSHLRGHTYHSTGSISPNSVEKELGGQPRSLGEGQTNTFNKNFISRSKSSSPSASISFV